MIGMTVCSGIGAPELSAPWIDWRYQSEIEPFPCAVLKHRFPDAINLGDMTKFKEWPDANVDVLCGGTPCQSFSVAGLRKGLADPRGKPAENCPDGPQYKALGNSWAVNCGEYIFDRIRTAENLSAPGAEKEM